jgi:hypothetical protein
VTSRRDFVPALLRLARNVETRDACGVFVGEEDIERGQAPVYHARRMDRTHPLHACGCRALGFRSLYRICYILHTLRPAPDTLYPIPYTLFHVPYKAAIDHLCNLDSDPQGRWLVRLSPPARHDIDMRFRRKSRNAINLSSSTHQTHSPTSVVDVTYLMPLLINSSNTLAYIWGIPGRALPSSTCMKTYRSAKIPEIHEVEEAAVLAEFKGHVHIWACELGAQQPDIHTTNSFSCRMCKASSLPPTTRMAPRVPPPGTC